MSIRKSTFKLAGGSRASFEEIYAAVCKIKDEVETEGLWKDPSVPTLTTGELPVVAFLLH